MLTILLAVILLGWIAAAVIGTQAYFRGEQSKPIHIRNWNSESFEQLSKSITGQEVDFTNRTLASPLDWADQASNI